MSGYTVHHGDTIIPVIVEKGDVEPIQAAASAQLHMKQVPFNVYDGDGQHVGTFTNEEIDEWWA